ncbi:MAG: SH3 domain-containing protein [Clostridia bacterium]|nr:SH3 domain-containing protein [Clostridia bacterium]
MKIRKKWKCMLTGAIAAATLCVSAWASNVVANASVNVRSAPDNSASIVCVLPKDAQAEKLGTFGNWVEIQYNGKTGYVYNKYVDDQVTATTTVYITASSLNVRSAPSTSASKIGSLTKNAAVQVISTSNGWHAIQYNGTTGYISAEYTTTEKPTSTGFQQRTVYAKAAVTVYSVPKTSGTKLGTLAKGEGVTATASVDGWYTVTYKNSVGFVRTSEMTTTKPAETTPTTTTVYTTAVLNVRAEASSSSTKLGSLAKGTAVETYGLSNGWYEIKFNGKTAYISAQYTTTTKPTTSVTPTSFTDVPSSAWYYTPVQWAVSNNITAGTSATKFSPNASCTRAQAVTFLWNAAGQPKVTGSCKFTDVSSNAWYYQAVLWAVNKGITSGTSATKFSPDAVCTRAEIVTFLWNAEGKLASSGSLKFTDVSSSAWYYGAVRWAVQNKITSGTSATKFSPNASCTRAQAVTFLYNYKK